MSNTDKACEFTLTQCMHETELQLYKQELLALDSKAPVIIDFRSILTIDYHLLNTLVSLKKTLSCCLNQIQFIIYSSELKELFDELFPEKYFYCCK